MPNEKEQGFVVPEGQVIQASGLLSLLMPQNSGVGVLVKGLDGRYQLANKAMGMLSGKNPDAIIGRTDRDFFPPAVAEQLQRSDEQIKNGAAAAREEFNVAINGQRTRWLSLKFPLLGPEGRVQSIGTVMIEMSRQELVAEMRQTLEKLQQTNQELQVSLVELDRLAGTDKLTGAWNRRRLEEAVNSEMDRLKRYDHPLCLLVLDIDLFKHVNDHYGHGVGDQLLLELAAQIRPALRAADSLTRWGGEEFVVLCPDTTLSTATVLAERLRKKIAGMNFPVAQKITISIGVAECMPGETWEQWFHRADAALFRAKALNRNQVQVAPEIPARTGVAETVPANFVRLVWHRAFECGHEVIDREHKALFQDSNELLAAILSGRPANETSAIADTLVRDVVQHFQDEESIIAAAGYPGAAKHAALHRNLVNRADALVGQFRAGKANVGELFQFLASDVIAKHMLGADRDFFSYLEKQRQAAA